MGIITAAFGALNALACIVCLIVYVMQYRKLKRQKDGFGTANDAYEFVEHFLLCLWWVLGTAIIYGSGVNPFWILAWFFLGLVLTFIVRGLVSVSGLAGFISVGEMHLRVIAREAAEAREDNQ